MPHLPRRILKDLQRNQFEESCLIFICACTGPVRTGLGAVYVECGGPTWLKKRLTYKKSHKHTSREVVQGTLLSYTIPYEEAFVLGKPRKKALSAARFARLIRILPHSLLYCFCAYCPTTSMSDLNATNSPAEATRQMRRGYHRGPCENVVALPRRTGSEANGTTATRPPPRSGCATACQTISKGKTAAAAWSCLRRSVPLSRSFLGSNAAFGGHLRHPLGASSCRRSRNAASPELLGLRCCAFCCVVCCAANLNLGFRHLGMLFFSGPKLNVYKKPGPRNNSPPAAAIHTLLWLHSREHAPATTNIHAGVKHCCHELVAEGRIPGAAANKCNSRVASKENNSGGDIAGRPGGVSGYPR